MTRSARHFALAVIAGATLVLVAAPAHAATTIPRSAADSFQSVQFDGQAVYWFQRYTRKHSRGVIFRRLFASPKTETVYEAPRGSEISGFRMRDGVIAISRSVGNPASWERPQRQIDVLRQSSGGWTSTTLMQRTRKPSTENCGERAKLLGIDATGRVIAEDIVWHGIDRFCDIVRAESTVSAFAADGSGTTLYSRKGAWTASPEYDTSLDSIFTGPGDWGVTFDYGTGWDGGHYGMRNLETDAASQFVVQPTFRGRPDVSAEGMVLANNPSSRTRLYTDPTNPTAIVYLSRPNSVAWFHLCGGKILEIDRAKRETRSNKRTPWNLRIRNLAGIEQRKLIQTMPRGTTFGACDGGTAIFHQQSKKSGKARQFVIGLNQP